MNKVDYDNELFDTDEYGNLIPKQEIKGFNLTDEEIEQCGYSADEIHGKDV